MITNKEAGLEKAAAKIPAATKVKAPGVTKTGTQGVQQVITRKKTTVTASKLVSPVVTRASVSTPTVSSADIVLKDPVVSLRRSTKKKRMRGPQELCVDLSRLC